MAKKKVNRLALYVLSKLAEYVQAEFGGVRTKAGEKLGYSQGMISAWLNGTRGRDMPFFTALDLARKMGLDMSKLAENVEDPALVILLHLSNDERVMNSLRRYAESGDVGIQCAATALIMGERSLDK